MQKVSIVLPVYNEEESLPQVLDDIRRVMAREKADWEIVVVDDGSTDRSAEIARRSGAVVVRHERNKGTGAARKTGVKNARGDIVVMLDADCTYPADQIPALLTYFPSYDMVVGARKREAGTLRLTRMLMKLFIRKLAEFVVKERIPDLNSGMRAFKRDLVKWFMPILPNSHSWVSTVTLAFLSEELRVAYHAIDYFPRKGHSTFHPLVDTYNYISLVIRTIMYFNPLRIFVPLSVLIIGVGIVKTIVDVLVLRDMQQSDIVLIVAGCLTGAIGLLADLIVTQSKLRGYPRA